MKCILCVIFIIISLLPQAQIVDSVSTQTQPPSANTEQQIENLTESSADLEVEDDSYLQQLTQFQKNPINLNTADESILKELLILTPLQIQNLIIYRTVLGRLINIYELQAVPAWDLRTIQRIRTYVTVGSSGVTLEDWRTRISEGDHSFLIRSSQVLERSRGYLVDRSRSVSFYPGSPQRLMLRYKYVYKNLLQYGVVAEKDPGEQFFKGSQKQGFDFYSFHVFARNLGIIKAVALGDFTVNLGQGLTQWQSLAFRKGPDITAIKRQAAVLRPYNSAAEINFQRGVGVTIGKNNWEATVFGSHRRLDANFITDSSEAIDDYVSSLQTSGYHRTKSEADDKGTQRKLAFGGNFALRLKRLHLGINAIKTKFELPLNKSLLPYNQYALNGTSFTNYSFDYSYTFRNMHFFGEAAYSNQKGAAFVNGLLLSAASNVDISLLYRNISPKYQALNGNAFTESSTPTNEKGLFTGISIRPGTRWQLDAYSDLFTFPWLRFRVDAPSSGTEYFLQALYRPNKQVEVYSRFRRESKPINFNPDELTFNPLADQPRENWRLQASYRLTPQFTVRSRTEVVWLDRKGEAAEEGYLINFDVFYKPKRTYLATNLRLEYFETDGYNSRLYAYESDVLYFFSVPVLYDKGFRYYLNVNYDFSKQLSIWVKWAQTIYSNRENIGSGLDEISGRRRSEVRVQALLKL